MSLPSPAEAATAFLASPEYAERWVQITRSVKKDSSWTITSYEEHDSSVHFYSPVGVQDHCDLLEEEVFGKEPDPGHVKRKAAIWLRVTLRLLDVFLDGPYIRFWSRMYPKVRRPDGRWDQDEHNHHVALLARADVKAQLLAESFSEWRDNLFTLLASPEVRAESIGYRERNALAELESGVRHLRKLGWADDAILARVQPQLAGTVGS